MSPLLLRSRFSLACALSIATCTVPVFRAQAQPAPDSQCPDFVACGQLSQDRRVSSNTRADDWAALSRAGFTREHAQQFSPSGVGDASVRGARTGVISVRTTHSRTRGMAAAGITSAPASRRSGPWARWIANRDGAVLMLRAAAGETVLVGAGPPSTAEAVVAELAASGIERIDLWVVPEMTWRFIGGAARIVAGQDARWGTPDDLEVAQWWDAGHDPRDSGDPGIVVYRVLAGAGRRSLAEPVAVGVPGLSVRAVPGDAAGGRRLWLCVDGPGATVAMGDLGRRTLELCPDADLLWWHSRVEPASMVDELPWTGPPVIIWSAGASLDECGIDTGAWEALRDRELWLLQHPGADPAGPCPPLSATSSRLGGQPARIHHVPAQLGLLADEGHGQ